MEAHQHDSDNNLAITPKSKAQVGALKLKYFRDNLPDEDTSSPITRCCIAGSRVTKVTICPPELKLVEQPNGDTFQARVIHIVYKSSTGNIVEDYYVNEEDLNLERAEFSH